MATESTQRHTDVQRLQGKAKENKFIKISITGVNLSVQSSRVLGSNRESPGSRERQKSLFRRSEFSSCVMQEGANHFRL